MTVKLVTDSTSYIPESVCEEHGIKIASLGVCFPDEFFLETEVDYNYFYEKIDREGIIPTSSQPAPGLFYKIFEQIVKNGDEVLGIFISTGISGTCGSAATAREMILEKYPEARIEIMDSRNVCMGLGLQVLAAAEAARNGKSMEEVLEAASWVRERVHFYFVPLTLDYLQKGGRIGGAAALIGSVLSIKPILYISSEGKIEVFEKVRGLQGAVKHLYKKLKKDVDRYGLKSLVVHQVHDLLRGQEVAQEIGDNLEIEGIPVLAIGPVIGLHVGPGSFGIVYCTE
ncbi:degv family protein [hydrocarbon metagenome]|uniref:Degv family protein n=1 Tax=hydrocarbon metagenome TaxID=938273 RepID=A0A0W8E679_9ZZZZ